MNQGFIGWPSIPPTGRVSTILAADVSIATSGTFVDGPSVTLTAGTWLVIGDAQFSVLGAIGLTAKLWDGTTIYASGAYTARASSGDDERISVTAIVTLAVTTTLKLSVTGNVNTTATLRMAAQYNPSGNSATQLNAVRIA